MPQINDLTQIQNKNIQIIKDRRFKRCDFINELLVCHNFDLITPTTFESLSHQVKKEIIISNH